MTEEKKGFDEVAVVEDVLQRTKIAVQEGEPGLTPAYGFWRNDARLTYCHWPYVPALEVIMMSMVALMTASQAEVMTFSVCGLGADCYDDPETGERWTSPVDSLKAGDPHIFRQLVLAIYERSVGSVRLRTFPYDVNEANEIIWLPEGSRVDEGGFTKSIVNAITKAVDHAEPFEKVIAEAKNIPVEEALEQLETKFGTGEQRFFGQTVEAVFAIDSLTEMFNEMPPMILINPRNDTEKEWLDFYVNVQRAGTTGVKAVPLSDVLNGTFDPRALVEHEHDHKHRSDVNKW